MKGLILLVFGIATGCTQFSEFNMCVGEKRREFDFESCIITHKDLPDPKTVCYALSYKEARYACK